ncbi:ABC transporter ATP-binding protein [Mesoaciditoga sp.]
MKILEVKNLNAHVGNFELRDISFCLNEDEILVFLGDNGAGKTKILEAVSGFIPLKSGTVRILGKDVTNVEVQKRKIGFIFQNLALFPHMTVKENVEFGLKYSKVPRAIFRNAIKSFKIEKFLNRYPDTLSGGERQRVALARTLVTNPTLVFLDEPTSALSPRERANTAKEIKAFLKKARKPAIFVTHNEEEAFLMGDRIAVVEKGKIAQIGKSDEIFYKPTSKEIANLFGTYNIFNGKVVKNESDVLTIEVKNKEIMGIGNFKVGESVNVFVRPEDVVLTCEKSKSSARNSFSGSVTSILKKGPIFEVKVDVGIEIISFVTKGSLEKLQLKNGKKVIAEFKATAIHIFK